MRTAKPLRPHPASPEDHTASSRRRLLFLPFFFLLLLVLSLHDVGDHTTNVLRAAGAVGEGDEFADGPGCSLIRGA